MASTNTSITFASYQMHGYANMKLNGIAIDGTNPFEQVIINAINGTNVSPSPNTKVLPDGTIVAATGITTKSGVVITQVANAPQMYADGQRLQDGTVVLNNGYIIKPNMQIINPSGQAIDPTITKPVITYVGEKANWQFYPISTNNVSIFYMGTQVLPSKFYNATILQEDYILNLTFEAPADGSLPARTINISDFPMSFIDYGTNVGVGTHFANDIDYTMSGQSKDNKRLLILYLRGNHTKLVIGFTVNGMSSSVNMTTSESTVKETNALVKMFQWLNPVSMTSESPKI